MATIRVTAAAPEILRAFIEGVSFVNDSAITVKKANYEMCVALMEDADSDDDSEVCLSATGNQA